MRHSGVDPVINQNGREEVEEASNKNQQVLIVWEGGQWEREGGQWEEEGGWEGGGCDASQWSGRRDQSEWQGGGGGGGQQQKQAAPGTYSAGCPWRPINPII